MKNTIKQRINDIRRYAGLTLAGALMYTGISAQQVSANIQDEPEQKQEESIDARIAFAELEGTLASDLKRTPEGPLNSDIGTRGTLIALVKKGEVQLTYAGRHDADIDPQQGVHYLNGRNSISAGKNSWYVKPSVVLMTGPAGVTDIKYGLRSTEAAQALGTRSGFIEGGMNGESSNITALLQYDVGHKWTASALLIANKIHNGDANGYSELQISYDASKHFGAFIRSKTKIGKDVCKTMGVVGVYLRK